MQVTEIIDEAKLLLIDEDNEEGVFKENKSILQDVLNRNLIELESNITALKEKSNTITKTYSDLIDIKRYAEQILQTTDKVIEDSDLEKMFKNGVLFDENELRRLYKEKKIKKIFPNFDFEKFLDILRNPIYEIENENGEIIKLDKLVVKKINIGLIQMIFDEMDIYMINSGIEGSGKSCHSSIWTRYLYIILALCKLITYAFDVRKLFYSSLDVMMEAILNQDIKDKFNMFILDEGNDLQRSNFREKTNQTFKHNMRISRKNASIVIINIQQLGELDTSITLSRCNFIFDCEIKNATKSGTLQKGKVTMYILPRGDMIYSQIHKKEFSKTEIRNAFAERLDRKKDYYVSLPREYAIHEYHFKGIWGFDKAKYDEFIKTENKKKLMGTDIKLSILDAYKLMLKLPPVKKWNTIDLKNPIDKTIYWSINKLMKKIKTYFVEHPERAEICKNILNLSDSENPQEIKTIERTETEIEIPEKYREELSYLPNLEEKPKTFYKDMNK